MQVPIHHWFPLVIVLALPHVTVSLEQVPGPLWDLIFHNLKVGLTLFEGLFLQTVVSLWHPERACVCISLNLLSLHQKSQMKALAINSNIIWWLYLFTWAIKSFSLQRSTCCGIRSKLLTDGGETSQAHNWDLFSYIRARLKSNCQ